MTEQRIKRLQQQLAADEALLVESGPNRFYLTGFSSSAGSVLITPRQACFLVDFRYIEKARAVVSGCEVELATRLSEQLCRHLTAANTRTLYVETAATTLARQATLAQAFAGITVSTDGRFDRLLEEMRGVKTADELALIRRAQAMTDDTFRYILPRIAPGRTEREIMLDMEFYLRRLGSEGVSFDFIVVSGKNSSLPHGVPTDKPVEAGDFVTMDFGAVVGGYRSDMTRTVAVRRADEEQRRVYDTVLAAQQAAMAAIRPGAVCREVDKIARELIDAAGYAGCFGHGLGHSVGLEIHENPTFSPRCDAVLCAGHVMTVEPGIYLENRFGVRIEDMVVVTADGYDNLTGSDKQLLIV